jgi:thioesterase domain-containing protein
LARNLGAEQPVYALQGAELADVAVKADSYESMEAIAEHYLEAITTIQRAGPFLLAGFSWGGVVAFEIAQKLLARGEKVGLLALLDTPSPPDLAKIDDLTDAEILVTLARDLATQRSVDLPLTVDDLCARTDDEQFRYVLQLLVQSKILTAEATPQWLKRHLAGYRARIRYVARYRPQPYDGKITLFRAAAHDQATIKQEQRVGLQAENPTFGWDRLSTQPVSVLTIPGTHSAIMMEPNVQALAALLNDQIRASQTEFSPAICLAPNS